MTLKPLSPLADAVFRFAYWAHRIQQDKIRPKAVEVTAPFDAELARLRALLREAAEYLRALQRVENPPWLDDQLMDPTELSGLLGRIQEAAP